MDFFNDDDDSVSDMKGVQLPPAIQPQRPSSGDIDKQKQQQQKQTGYADEFGSFSSSIAYSTTETSGSEQYQPPVSGQPLVLSSFPPPPKPAATLVPATVTTPSPLLHNQPAGTHKELGAAAVSDVSGPNAQTIMADQVLCWMSECHQPRQKNKHGSEKDGRILDADIDKAWEDAEGLMGGEGSHMYIHIGEIATRLCSVITASNNAAADELSSAPSTGHTNRNPDPLSNTSTTDGENHSYHHDDYSSESLLVIKQSKHRHLSKSRLDDPELVWNTVWPNTSGVAYKDEDELPVPANNPNGDLVKAYLQLADIANKQRV